MVKLFILMLMKMNEIGILCGFAAEADVARAFTPLVGMSGAVEELAYVEAKNLIERGAKALISFGVAGALDYDVTPEAIFVPGIIKASDGREWACTPSLITTLRTALPHTKDGAVFGSKQLVPDHAEKKKLHDQTGCTLVDMESHVVAEIASTRAIPFAVLRGISDNVEDTFPDAALKGIHPDGTTNYGAVFFSLLANPLQLPALLRLFRHTGVALEKLRQCLELLEKNEDAVIADHRKGSGPFH